VTQIDESKQTAHLLLVMTVILGLERKFFGPITIGNGCVIGANAVVSKSFEGNHQTSRYTCKIIAENGSRTYKRRDNNLSEKLVIDIDIWEERWRKRPGSTTLQQMKCVDKIHIQF
jgi:serine acetyltransferase